MRSIPAVAFCMVLATATSFTQSLQSGTFSANVSSESWTLNGGSGSRTHIVFVKFQKPFTAPPTVTLSLTGYDGAAGKDGNVRVSIKHENISREGFVIKVSTWGDSRLTGVEGSWIASGK